MALSFLPYAVISLVNIGAVAASNLDQAISSQNARITRTTCIHLLFFKASRAVRVFFALVQTCTTVQSRKLLSALATSRTEQSCEDDDLDSGTKACGVGTTHSRKRAQKAG